MIIGDGVDNNSWGAGEGYHVVRYRNCGLGGREPIQAQDNFAGGQVEHEELGCDCSVFSSDDW
jgi:hypothetical protein